MTVQVDFSKLDLQDALDLAVLIEKEAEERYRWFASMLGERYPGDAPSRVTADMIEDVEAPGSGSPRPYMSPRHALEVAMDSEIKAYAFFDQALPGIRDAAVRQLFEELRDEEAVHQGLLEQQKARYPETMEPDVDPEDVDTPAL